jgi:multicomponent Na+:H+ antiporter subunit F
MNLSVNLILILMILALLIPIYSICKSNDIWQKMLAFTSASSKASVLILVISVFRDDWMVGAAGAIILSVGNAGFMLLAHLIKRMNPS